MGVPQSDGGLPATMLRANAIVSSCARIAEIVHMHGGRQASSSSHRCHVARTLALRLKARASTPT
eukprot:1226810-Pleurochrysis_carterae.AAC.1